MEAREVTASADFRDGKTFPRRGRTPIGRFLWLARVFDKARATANGTQGGYIYPCPMDRAVMRRWGIEPPQFTAAVSECQTDDQVAAWLSERVPPDRVRAANTWVVRQRLALDVQDVDERVQGAPIALTLTMLLWMIRAAAAAVALVFLKRLFLHWF
jgi:Domain of unknown function (DUF5069)